MKKLNLRLLRLIGGSIGQFLAVVAVVTVGLLIYTAMGMAVRNLELSVESYYQASQFADVYVELTRIPESALEDVRRMDSVDVVEGRIVQDVSLEVKDPKERVRIRLMSVPSAGNAINRLNTVDGDGRLRQDQGILLIQHFADARGLRPGSTVNPHITGRTYGLEVQGIVTTPEYIYLMENEQSILPDKKSFGVGFVTQDFAQRAFGYGKSFNQVVIKAKPGTNLDLLKDRIEKKLKKYGIRRIYTRENQLSARIVEEEVRTDKKTAQVVPGIFLAVAAVIILVMVNRMVRNDRMIIGVFKALGYTGGEILMHYAGYALLIGLAGAVPALWLGTWLSQGIASMWLEFFDIPTLVARIYPDYYVGALVLTCTFCVGAGIWGGRSVLGIQPAQAMWPASPKAARRIWLEQIKWFWTRVPFTWKIAIRNMFRSKKRMLLIGAGIAVTYAVTLMPLYLSGSMSQLFLKQYTEFQNMDFTLTFAAPVDRQALRDLSGVPGIKRYEPLEDFPFEIHKGWRYKVVNVVGLQQNTEFYNLKDLKGTPLKPPKNGVLISESLARILEAEAGDKLVFKSFIPGREDVSLPIVGIVDQALGINAYLEIHQMQNELLEPGWVTGAMIRGDDRVRQELKAWKGILSIQSRQDLMEIYQEFMQLTLTSLGIMILFSFILGFAIIYNATMMTIHERKMEFSSLRVLGFGGNEIFALILKENGIIAVIGIAAGIPLGWYLIQAVAVFYSSELYTLKADYSPETFVLTAGITLLFVILSQGAAYERIRRLDFIEALKNRIS